MKKYDHIGIVNIGGTYGIGLFHGKQTSLLEGVFCEGTSQQVRPPGIKDWPAAQFSRLELRMLRKNKFVVVHWLTDLADNILCPYECVELELTPSNRESALLAYDQIRKHWMEYGRILSGQIARNTKNQGSIRHPQSSAPDNNLVGAQLRVIATKLPETVKHLESGNQSAALSAASHELDFPHDDKNDKAMEIIVSEYTKAIEFGLPPPSDKELAGIIGKSGIKITPGYVQKKRGILGLKGAPTGPKPKYLI